MPQGMQQGYGWAVQFRRLRGFMLHCNIPYTGKIQAPAAELAQAAATLKETLLMSTFWFGSVFTIVALLANLPYLASLQF